MISLVDSAEAVPEGAKWAVALAGRGRPTSVRDVGVGVVTRNAEGQAIAALCLSPKEAIQLACSLIASATKLEDAQSQDSAEVEEHLATVAAWLIDSSRELGRRVATRSVPSKKWGL